MTVREYITHWAVAGVIVTTTGFTPDHWVARLMEGIPAGFRYAFPSGIGYHSHGRHAVRVVTFLSKGFKDELGFF